MDLRRSRVPRPLIHLNVGCGHCQEKSPNTRKIRALPLKSLERRVSTRSGSDGINTASLITPRFLQIPSLPLRVLTRCSIDLDV
jgi:hypothetical protein